MNEQYCLKWNNYQASLTSAFKNLREEEDFVDVTLSAQGKTFKAHKVVLSACSPYFRDILRGVTPWQHPVLMLKDVPYRDISSILEFVYLGEVNVNHDNLQSFLKTAEALHIKGLTEDSNSTPIDTNESSELSSNVRKSSTPQQQPKTPTVKRPKLEQISSNSNNEMSHEFVNLKEEPTFDQRESDLTEEEAARSFDDSNLYNDELVPSDGLIDSEQLGVPIDSSIIQGMEMGLENDVLNEGIENDTSQGSNYEACTYCHKYITRSNMKRHINEVHLNSNFTQSCSICNQTFRSRGTLDYHVYRVHRNISKQTNSQHLFASNSS